MPQQPTARVDVVRDTYHRVTVDDPYRWMEQESAELEWRADSCSPTRSAGAW